MTSINLVRECWDSVALSTRIYVGAVTVGVVCVSVVSSSVGFGLLRLLFRVCLLLAGFAVGLILCTCFGPRRTGRLDVKRNPISEVLNQHQEWEPLQLLSPRSGIKATKIFLSSKQPGCLNHKTATSSTVAKPTVLSRSLDRALQEVLENFFRDYMLTWFKKVAEDEEGFKSIIMDEAWVIVEKLAQRLKAVDMVKFLTEDVVVKLTNHFQELRHSQHFQTRATGSQSTSFTMHPCVESTAKEVEFLRVVSEVLVCTLLPDTDSQCMAMKVLLREVLAFQVLQPGIEELCDPDYINQTLLAHLEYREAVTEKTRASYAYAQTYGAFVKIIKECHEIEKLQGIRYHIIAEIMQATVIQNLKEAKGIGAEERDAVIGHVKGELLMNRNLKRYINQCKFAQNLCEKRIHDLGGPDYGSSSTLEPEKLPHNIKKTSFAELMSDELSRGFLIQFMNQEKTSAPLRLWIAIEEMLKTDLDQMRYHSSKLYKLHLASDSPDPVLDLRNSVVRDFNLFSEGTKDKRAVIALQDEVYDLIEEQYYRKFLGSELYFRYVNEKGPDASTDTLSRPSSSGSEEDKEDYCMVGEEDDTYNTFTLKMELLKGSLRKKMSVLKGLRSRQSASPDIAQLQEEVEQIQSEIRELEFHIERTREYVSTMGKWKIQIPSCQVVVVKGHQVPVYTIIVHKRHNSECESSDKEDEDTSSMAAGSSGWVVTRKLTEFEAMHHGLKECGLLKYDLPRPSQGLFGSKDKQYLIKSRQLLETYLQSLVRDEKLYSSEELYHFLIPSPERLRHGSLRPVPQKKFFPTEVLKSVPFLGDFIESLIASAEEADEDDDLEGSRDRRDSIAESLYDLVREVFELKGVFKWLRRQLMVFVQVTFGRTINKQIRETVKWLTCDGMIVYYVHTFRDSWWPNGKLAPSRPVRSDEEKATTKEAAKEKLLKNIPENIIARTVKRLVTVVSRSSFVFAAVRSVILTTCRNESEAVLQNFVGQKNSRHGILKLFDSLQDARANKHIFYVLLEVVMFNLIPEVKSEKVRQRLQAMQSKQQTVDESEATASS